MRGGRIAAGQEAYELHESQRQSRIGAQLGLRDELGSRTRYGWGSPPLLDDVYWHGPDPYLDPYLPGPAVGPLVEPYSRPWETLRQPVGHRSIQTAPNRWEYRPIYADEEVAGEPNVQDVGPALLSEEVSDEPPVTLRHREPTFDRRRAAPPRGGPREF